jgi:hypothetical protein
VHGNPDLNRASSADSVPCSETSKDLHDRLNSYHPATGSWGDNELSPECLDGARDFLKPGGLSIPSSYTSFVGKTNIHKSNRTDPV